MELVLTSQRHGELRDRPNPARWRGNLGCCVAQANKLAKVEHHAAVNVTTSLSLWVDCASSREGCKSTIRNPHSRTFREVRGAVWSE